MKPPSSAAANTNTNTNANANAIERDQRIKHLPPVARAAFEQFQKEGNPVALNPVVYAIVEDFIPKPPEKPFAELPPSTRLIEDLQFDSLAITEVVFFTEDLFGITITNEEIVNVRTLGDLLGFIHRKVAPAARG